MVQILQEANFFFLSDTKRDFYYDVYTILDRI